MTNRYRKDGLGDSKKSAFSMGKQPCSSFKGKIEHHEHGSWENRHECYKCGGEVSFCENCASDHHKHGYDTCMQERS